MKILKSFLAVLLAFGIWGCSNVTGTAGDVSSSPSASPSPSSSPSSTPTSVNADCRTSTSTSSVSVTATNVTGYKYLDIPYKPASSTTLTQVSVMLSSSSCSTFSTNAGTMYLYSDSSGSPNAVISTGPTLPCSSLSSSSAMITFAFSSVSLTGGTQYHFVFKLGGLTAGDTVTLSEYATSSSNCSGNNVGNILLLNGSWTNMSGSDIGIVKVNN